MIIKPFKSDKEMIAHHVAMFGPLGQIAAEAVLRWASLWPGIDPLDFRVLLAPIELAPYGRHHALTVPPPQPGGPRIILVNRWVVGWRADGSIGLTGEYDEQRFIDLLVHEMTHQRQWNLLRDDPSLHTARGEHADHHDGGWYGAVTEAAPAYLGVEFLEERWPKQKVKVGDGSGRLTEVEACHWPRTFRALIAKGDTRLSPVGDRAA
jgi:hypothetical protein